MKKVVLVLVLLIMLCGALYAFVCLQTSQDYIYADRADGRICDMPVGNTPLFVTVMPGLQFKLDTGSDMSLLSAKDMALLDSLGYSVREVFGISTGRNGLGKIMFETKRYRVDLPTYRYDTVTDSLGIVTSSQVPSSLNVLHNVDFVLAPDDMSVLGIDFLEKFKVEYRFMASMISLYLDVPDGYEQSIPMFYTRTPINALWLGKRYYLSANVMNRNYKFFIDSGIQRADFKLPFSERIYSKNKLYSDTVVSFSGRFPAFIDNASWVTIGNRSGRRRVYYYDNDEEIFALNPFNAINQDLVIDFSGLSIMLRPYYNVDPK